ncbi:MAG: hypothetical protein JNK82_26950 [Myxococcaceae bacterium]|nr:hypothetical protein [Myxococcaceae bacterium]
MIGVDANADGLALVSRKAPPNALFGRLSLDDAPGILEGVAASVTVLMPWGSLLTAVATGDVSKLRALGGELRIVYGTGDADRLTLPDPMAVWGARARPMTLDEVRALPTTWAKKLAFSGHARSFFEVVLHPT